jgi:hypothetical protein
VNVIADALLVGVICTITSLITGVHNPRTQPPARRPCGQILRPGHRRPTHHTPEEGTHS